ncbi:unnamed protein product [Lathyrus sativus]|nr:unnamed protein product [Lathyrus sativus]
MKMKMKKKKRTCLKSMKKKKKRTCIKSDFYLPDDCWEYVFSFIINPVDDIKKLNFKSLSLVSKQFLSITNRLIFSMKIDHLHLSYLPCFFHRFSSLNSLDLSFGSCYLDSSHAATALALRDRSTLKSLSISWIMLMDANHTTSHYIASFVSLKGLNSLKFLSSRISDDLLYSIAREALPLKTFVLQNCTGYSYQGIYALLSECY